MSMIRKTVLTTAIIGAGLASTAGAAFAGDDPCDSGHHSSGHEHSSSHWSHSSKDASGCSNSFRGETGNSENIGGLLNDSQGAIGLNVCDLVSHNNVLNGNTLNA